MHCQFIGYLLPPPKGELAGSGSENKSSSITIAPTRPAANSRASSRVVLPAVYGPTIAATLGALLPAALTLGWEEEDAFGMAVSLSACMEMQAVWRVDNAASLAA